MSESVNLSELHWLLTIVQSIDVGVVVLDRQYRIEVWNTFMENRSGQPPGDVRGQSIIYDVTDVATNRRQLQAANRELQRLSSTDRLTGLFNRGHWEEMLRQEYARHRRYDRNAALVMFDIDHFKKINDSYGHQAGDAVIQQTAELVRQCMRDADIAGRYGGEEFVVLLPDTDSDGALTFAERFRQTVEAHEVVYENHRIHFTVSLGIADLSQPTSGYAQLIERADSALYSSKAGGRNQVSLYR